MLGACIVLGFSLASVGRSREPGKHWVMCLLLLAMVLAIYTEPEDWERAQLMLCAFLGMSATDIVAVNSARK